MIAFKLLHDRNQHQPSRLIEGPINRESPEAIRIPVGLTSQTDFRY